MENKLDLHLGLQGILHNLSEETLGLLRRAGFSLAYVGVESGSAPQLRRFKKPATARMMAEGIQRAKRHHFFIIASFIAGGKGETDQDHEASKRFLRDYSPHACEIGSLKAYPGSRVWEEGHAGREPRSLAETELGHYYDLDDRLPMAVVRRRVKDFRRAFQRRLLNWRTLTDLYHLRGNRMLKLAIRSLLKDPSLLCLFYQRFQRSQ